VTELSSRYSRQILFGDIGIEGQQRLTENLAVILGCGALGTVHAEALCRAGVGRLRIIDRDFVEESNLQRQTLFTEDDARAVLPKAVAAQRRLGQINSEVRVEALVADINANNIESLVQGATCILDATDNFETRFLINDAAIKHQIPWVYGAAVGSYGVSMTVLPRQTPCLRCVLEKLPAPGSSPTCDTAGVLSPIVNVIASVQVAEALKILSGNIRRINRRMLCFDVWENSYRQIEIANVRDEGDCPCCQLRRFEFLEGVGNSAATTLCGRDSVQISVRQGSGLNLKELAQRLKAVGKVQINEFLLRLTVDQFEIAVFPDGRGIVRGTKDAQVARSLYAKYVGV
jgi:molybdopterin/thiamine biosynthesis adenylyltransferase